MSFNLVLDGRHGGRDLITGASLRDLDFTVKGNPSKIARELERATNSRTKAAAHRVLFGGDVEGAFRPRGMTITCGRDAAGDSLVTLSRIYGGAIFAERDSISLHPASRGLLLDPTTACLT